MSLYRLVSMTMWFRVLVHLLVMSMSFDLLDGIGGFMTSLWML
jgi:hypothetical protein